MTMVRRILVTIFLAGIGVYGGLFWSGPFTPGGTQPGVTEANALIGRPATPMSFAGVARRTTRRVVMYR